MAGALNGDVHAVNTSTGKTMRLGVAGAIRGCRDAANFAGTHPALKR
jgi:hypothetical protein